MGLNLFSSKFDPKGYNYCIAYIVKVIIFGTLDILYLQFDFSNHYPNHPLAKSPPLQKNKQNEQHGMYLEANQLLVAILFPT